MSYLKIYIHIVFSTKNRIPYFSTLEQRIKVWRHIKENAIEKGIFMDVVNGYSDHFHCLISLSSNQNIENIVQLIKGESSYWINKNCLTKKNLHGKKNILRFLFQNRWLNNSSSEENL